jgi:hypothetical protein
MHIKAAIKCIHDTPLSWVRVQQVRKTRGGLDLYLSIHEEQRGRKQIDAWTVSCVGVREAHI